MKKISILIIVLLVVIPMFSFSGETFINEQFQVMITTDDNGKMVSFTMGKRTKFSFIYVDSYDFYRDNDIIVHPVYFNDVLAYFIIKINRLYFKCDKK
jgi:hypothetical protein